MIKATHTKREKALGIYPRLAFRLSVATHARIIKLADSKGASISWVVNQCIEKALTTMEKK